MIILSPHLDDAALSCGGWIHALAEAGEIVTVITVCAGDPADGPLSEFAAELHQRWDPGAPPARVTAGRRAEDRAALAALGARVEHWDVPDCIYRRDPATGAPLYPALPAIFGALHPADLALAAALTARLAARLPADAGLCLPLGLGGHVDHQLARRAAEGLGRPLRFYEDYPYASGEAGLAGGGARWAALYSGLTPEIQPLAEADLQAKTAAIAAYTSQVSSFWPDLDAMRTSVRRFAEQTGGGQPAERFWKSPG